MENLRAKSHKMKVEKFLDEYLKHYSNYKEYWNYEDGCVLMGCRQMHEATGDEAYYEFIATYLKDFIQEDGNIEHYELGKFNIDSINAGKVLFYIYEKTGEEKYRKAIEFIMEQLRAHPRCECGNFWHKNIYPNQIWLDGLYMAQPFYMEYETKYNQKENYNDITRQFVNVRKYLFNDEKKLYYHAYDEAKIQPWCNKQTGCSPNFWLRSMGWYLMALVDVLDNMSQEIYEQYRILGDLFKEAVNGILQYADEDTELFFQVIDRSDVEGNYIETSGSAMVAYAIIKGCRLGILSKEKYADTGIGIIDLLIELNLIEDETGIHLTDICHVAGLGPGEQRDGSVEYYLSEKKVSDDSKGVGPFMMAYAQMLMYEKEQGGLG